MPTPVRGLFETHLTVADVSRSTEFYRDVVGLPLALDLPERNAAFLWIGEPGRAMLGLWGTGSAVNTMRLHIAFDVALDDLLQAPERARGGCDSALLLRPGDKRAGRARLDARGGGVLQGPRRAFTGVPNDAGRAGPAGSRDRPVLKLVRITELRRIARRALNLIPVVIPVECDVAVPVDRVALMI